jgi:hypothetical protein
MNQRNQNQNAKSGMGRTIRRSAMLALFLVLGLGAWQLARPAPDPLESAEQRLQERMAIYLDLRLKGDFASLYKLADPTDRKSVDLKKYLTVYDHGVMQIHNIKVLSSEVHLQKRRADVLLETDAELLVSKLPAPYRNGFRNEDPSALRTTREYLLQWNWRNGEWFFRIDREIVSGRDQDGNALSFLTPPSNGSPGGKN